MTKSLFTLYCLLLAFLVTGCEPEKKPDNIKSEIRNPKSEMVFIGAGKFTMGSRGKLEQGYDGGDGRVGLEVGVDEIPAHSVEVKGFYIYPYEVTNAQYKKFIDATGHRIPVDSVASDAPYNWKDGTFPPGEERHPVVNVSWFDAFSYCSWAGMRLPTEIEWEKTCRGTDARKWSYGNHFISQYANTYELQLAWSQAGGSFPEDRSPLGEVYDLSGNVSEWTSSWYNAYPGATLERVTFGKQNKVIKGGSFLTPAYVSRCAGRSFAVPQKRHRTMGFRCAIDSQE